ncbi:putative bifunctional diguanylate cyclase/phosphodiesterase [Spongisporangium articulatum]|uniref:Bifunctional diguanylate cyclase/phosphodiesterase n=1 Tax=Spongisporangium articulatum TaxID=3362603 RepID=A0ABW8ATK1_9ACTN
MRAFGSVAHARGRLAFAALLVGLSAVYLSAPDGSGAIALFASAVVGLIAFTTGMLVHRPVNRQPWMWATAAGLGFLGSLIVRFVATDVPGPLGNPDLWAFAGYGLTVPFLVGLLRRTYRGADPTLWLDTAAVVTGSALISWVMSIAPQLNSDEVRLGPVIVYTVYPVMDALLLSLTVQLGFRRGPDAPALQALMVAMTALLVGDFAYTFVWATHPGANNPYLNIAYIVAYCCMGLTAAHPSMRELSDVDVEHRPGTSRARLGVIFATMLTPATIPLVLPVFGVVDAFVRAVLMTGLGLFVYLRLLGTLQALSTAEAAAQYRATHDLLTGLPNRAALMQQLDDHLHERAAGHGQGWVNVFFVDCDHFKQINDTWGHTAGDEVLIELGHRLRELSIGTTDLARVGGDEFVLWIDTPEAAGAEAFARAILDVFDTPVQISEGRSTRLTTSIGIAQVRFDHRTSAGELLQNADMALYQAKAEGRATFAVYDASMHDQVARRLELADALRGALDRAEISVVFQPIRGGAGFADLVGWEALARWTHPDFGPVSPVEFVPIAEDTGLIVDIGAFVMRRAARQLADWQRLFGSQALHVSVNVSSVQLMRDDVCGLVAGVLEETGLEPHSLWLEITESVVLDRTDMALQALVQLGEMGVKLALDDFGTGYSSLSYLKDFDLHVLKVDRAFVRNLAADRRDQDLTKAMIDVAAALRLEGVVAEGVEDEEQAAFLLELGCSMAQGWLYGKPLPAEEATEAARETLRQSEAAARAALLRTAPVPTPREPDDVRASATG